MLSSNELRTVEILTYRYILFLFSLIVSIIFSVSSVRSPPQNYGSSFGQALYSLSPLVLGQAFSFLFFVGYQSIQWSPILTGMVFLSLIVLFTWASTTQIAQWFTTGTLYLAIGVLIVAAAVAILLQILRFSSGFRITDEPTWQNFIMQFILYIPCLLEDFATYLGEQFGMTSAPIVILLIIEILFLVLFFSLPSIIQAISSQGKVVVLPGALPLSIITTLADSSVFESDMVNRQLSTGQVPTHMFRSNYGISMWIYLNKYDSTLQEQELQIFNYGSDALNGNPSVYVKSGQVYVSLSNADRQATRVPIDMMAQKWNQLVINYRYGEADVFLNAVLIDTISLTDYMPTYATTDTMVIGDNRGSLSGAICNITYSNNPFLKAEVAASYNFLRMFNPPVLPGVSSSMTPGTVLSKNKKKIEDKTFLQKVQDEIQKVFPNFVISNSSPPHTLPLNNNHPQFAGFSAPQTLFTTKS